VVPVRVPFRDSEFPGSRSGRCRLPPSIQTEDAIRRGLERFLCLGPSVAGVLGVFSPALLPKFGMVSPELIRSRRSALAEVFDKLIEEPTQSAGGDLWDF